MANFSILKLLEDRKLCKYTDWLKKEYLRNVKIYDGCKKKSDGKNWKAKVRDMKMYGFDFTDLSEQEDEFCMALEQVL